jgi:hypothetical protein
MRCIRAGVMVLAMMTASALTACSRSVDVESGAAPAAEVSINFTNSTTQPANVYVLAPSGEIFLRQVAANSTEALSVRSIAAGTSVQLEARMPDGKKYTSNSMTLSSNTSWRIP